MKWIIKKHLLFLIFSTALANITHSQELTRITMLPMNVVYVVDTAQTSDDISPKMGKGYGTLFMLIGQQQLKPGKVLSIYHTTTAPWIFDIAVEVDRKPVKLTAVVQYKTIEGGDAIVVHYKGPYEQIEKAYILIESWLMENSKQKKGPPIEAYLNDPEMVKEKNELLTDVYQLIK